MLKPPLYALDGSDGSVDFSSVLEEVWSWLVSLRWQGKLERTETERGQEVRGKDKPESRVRRSARSALDTTMNERRQEEIKTIDKRERTVRGSRVRLRMAHWQPE
jgi:hypothetical protein